MVPGSNGDAYNRSDTGNGFFLDDFLYDDFSVSSMSAQLTIRGEYQPGTSLRIRTLPTSVEAVINVLERNLPLRSRLAPYKQDPKEEERVFNRCGATAGYFSLARLLESQCSVVANDEFYCFGYVAECYC